ncbi:beta-1,6-N-acetylglucosaminyltransferase [Vibrio breoganii]|uniref:beta-1,6-N-acetylglucosaminyltransferase n=1 Tax=Vibrio breoganii TaxID=553239 RepID=UPI000C81890A|nr:beta-1,6-N-acetylglucosaminyltransferase [Vibrio breoganii]PMG95097.1 hypothetical protein BCU81_00055 [Vibrio breoganii]
MNRIAFIILAHNEPELLLRTACRLIKIGDVYIHIDAKTDISSFKALRDIERVYFINDRVSVNWAGWSMVSATVNLFKAARCKPYDKFVLLSGQDYPIKGVNHIKDAILSDDLNVVNGVLVNRKPSQLKYFNHISRYYFYDIHGVLGSSLAAKSIRRLFHFFSTRFRKKIDASVRWVHGSQWCVINRSSLDYLVSSYDNRNEITKILKYGFAPDEYFIQTQLENSKNPSHNINLIDSESTGTFIKANIHVIDKSLSKYYSLSDLDYLVKSDKLFVRKVNYKYSKTLLDKLDEIFE